MDAPPPVPNVRREASTEGLVGQTTDEGKGRIFPCESCGADLVFEIGVQQLQCPYCERQQEIVLTDDCEIVERDYASMLETLNERRRENNTTAHTQIELFQVRCESCGSEVAFHGSLKSSECAYCASPIQVDAKTHFEFRIPVDGVLPFRISEDQAENRLAKWAKKLWFAPNRFKERVVQEPVSGIYLPYWTFDSASFTRYTGQRGEYYYVTVGSGKNKRTVRRTRWYPASGSFQRFFDDVLIAAAKNLPTKILRKLEPWPLGSALPFNEQVLAGFVAKTYEVELPTGFVRARQRMKEALTVEVKSRIGGDTQTITTMDVRHDAVTYKQLMLPLWLLAYKSPEKKRVYRVFVNAVTGEVQGERPWSWIKIAFAVFFGLIIAGVIAIIANANQ